MLFRSRQRTHVGPQLALQEQRECRRERKRRRGLLSARQSRPSRLLRARRAPFPLGQRQRQLADPRRSERAAAVHAKGPDRFSCVQKRLRRVHASHRVKKKFRPRARQIQNLNSLYTARRLDPK